MEFSSDGDNSSAGGEGNGNSGDLSFGSRTGIVMALEVVLVLKISKRALGFHANSCFKIPDQPERRATRKILHGNVPIRHHWSPILETKSSVVEGKKYLRFENTGSKLISGVLEGH